MLVAFLSDIHFPHHDPMAWALALQVLHAAQPDQVHLGGDIIDCEAISDFYKPPQKLLGFQHEIDVARAELEKVLDSCPNAKMLYREGNHEFRLKRYLARYAPLATLEALTIPELLDLSKLGMTWLPQEQRYKIGKLYFIHGHEQRASYLYPARSLYQKLGGNIICGHFHKFDKHVHKQFRGTSHGVWVNACLSTLTPDYLVNAQWEQGISLIDFSPNGFFKVLQVSFDPVRKGSKQLYAVWQGQAFQSG